MSTATIPVVPRRGAGPLARAGRRFLGNGAALAGLALLAPLLLAILTYPAWLR